MHKRSKIEKYTKNCEQNLISDTGDKYDILFLKILLTEIREIDLYTLLFRKRKSKERSSLKEIINWSVKIINLHQWKKKKEIFQNIRIENLKSI